MFCRQSTYFHVFRFFVLDWGFLLTFLWLLELEWLWWRRQTLLFQFCPKTKPAHAHFIFMSCTRRERLNSPFKAGFHFSEFGCANRYDRMLWHWKEAISLVFAHSGREQVEFGSASRADCAFASKRSLSAWISSCACPDSPLLGRAVSRPR